MHNVYHSRDDLVLNMTNPKEILLKELSEKLGDKISEQALSEKVNSFIKGGNIFLLFEVMNLVKEIESIKEDIKSINDNPKKSVV